MWIEYEHFGLYQHPPRIKGQVLGVQFILFWEMAASHQALFRSERDGSFCRNLLLVYMIDPHCC
jgi:hypothetical protein